MRSLRIILGSLFLLLVALIAGIGAWISTPSDKYITVLGYSVERVNGEWLATSGRILPQGDILADWTLTFMVNSPEHARVCHAEGFDLYDEGKPSPVTYTVSPWADACLNGTDPVFVTVTRTVRLWGFLPLYPARFTFQVLPRTEPEPTPLPVPPSLLAPAD